jgi:hypothetical protein
MSNHQEQAKAINEINAKYAPSIGKLKEVIEYLNKCKYIEALSLNTPGPNDKVVLHVFKKGLIRGKEQVVERDYLLGLMNDVKNYRAELAKGMPGNEKIIRDALADLEKSRKGLESLSIP